jgi:high-affinity iron transporter
MFPTFLIGLREGLEIALLVGILLAYLVRSGRWQLIPRVWLGVVSAVVLSIGFGALLTYGPSQLSSRTEEIVAGVLSILAVGLVTWMVFWMARASRFLRAGLEAGLDARLGGATASGGWAVTGIAFLAVGREGLETALLLWGAAGAAEEGWAPLVGAALGLATAAALCWAIYRGAVSVDLRTFFSWTGVLLVMIAGGVLAYGVHELQEAGVLPVLTRDAFDVSAVIDPDSWLGVALRGVLGFSPTPSWAQVVAWVGYVVPTATLYLLAGHSPLRTAGPTPQTETPNPTQTQTETATETETGTAPQTETEPIAV